MDYFFGLDIQYTKHVHIYCFDYMCQWLHNEARENDANQVSPGVIDRCPQPSYSPAFTD